MKDISCSLKNFDIRGWVIVIIFSNYFNSNPWIDLYVGCFNLIYARLLIQNRKSIYMFIQKYDRIISELCSNCSKRHPLLSTLGELIISSSEQLPGVGN